MQESQYKVLPISNASAQQNTPLVESGSKVVAQPSFYEKFKRSIRPPEKKFENFDYYIDSISDYEYVRMSLDEDIKNFNISPFKENKKRRKNNSANSPLVMDDSVITDFNHIRERLQHSAPNSDKYRVMNSLDDFLDKVKSADTKNLDLHDHIMESQAAFDININHNHDLKFSTAEKVWSYFTSDPQTLPPLKENKAEGLRKHERDPSGDTTSEDEFFSVKERTGMFNFPNYNGNWMEWIFKILGKGHSSKVILSFTIVSLIAYFNRPTKFTRYMLFCLTSLMILKEMVSFNRDDEDSLLSHIMPLWHKLDEETKEEKVFDVDMEEISSQSFDNGEFDMISGLVTVLVTSSLGFCAKGKFSDALLCATKTTDTQTKNITSVLLIISSKLRAFFKDVCQADKIGDYFYVESVTNEDVKQFNHKVAVFKSLVNAGSAASDRYCIDVFTTYIQESEVLMKKLDYKSYDYKSLMRTCDELAKMKQTVYDKKATLCGDRVEPVAILIKGAPGCKKSVLSTRLGRMIAKLTVPKEWKQDYDENDKDFHFVFPTDKWFDGYTNKAWVSYMDDVFQRRDVAGDESSDALHVIAAVNSAPYCLPMANVNLKNSVYFRSPFLIANTNLQNWDIINSINAIDAVQRRFIELDVTINPKYTTRTKDGLKTDSSKLPAYMNKEGEFIFGDSKQIKNDYWVIQMTTKDGDRILDQRQVSVKEVVMQALDSYRDHIRHYEVNKATNDECSEEMYDELLDYFKRPDFSPPTPPKEMEPQSGDTESILGVSNSYITVSDMHQRYKTLSHEERKEYSERFYANCKGLDRMDLYSGGFKRQFLDHFNHATASERLWYYTNFYDKDMFFNKLYTAMQFFLKEGFDPISGKPEWRVETTTIESFMIQIREFGESMYEFISDNILYIGLGGMVLGGALYFLGGFFKSVINPESQSVDYSRLSHRVGKKSGMRIKLQELHPSVHVVNPQGFDMLPLSNEIIPKLSSLDFGDRSNNTDISAKLFNSYFFIIYVVDNKLRDDGTRKTVRWGHCINVCGQLFMMPFHFIYQMFLKTERDDYTGAHVVLVSPLRNNRYNLTMEDFIDQFKTSDTASENDVCLVRVKTAQMSSVGAIKYMLKEKDVERTERTMEFGATLAGTFNRGPDVSSMSLRTSSIHAMFHNKPILVKAKWDPEEPLYKLNRTIHYLGSTFGGGDCGAMLLMNNANYENRILIGMHVAGDHQNGYSTLVTQESVRALSSECYKGIEFFRDEIQPEYYRENINIESQCATEPVGELISKYKPGDVTWSEIQKSNFYGKLLPPYNVVKTIPAKLKPFMRDGELIDPHALALAKYGQMPSTIPIHYLEYAAESYEQLIINNTTLKSKYREVIPLNVALHGFENVSPIASDTSPGFPYNLSFMDDIKADYYKACIEIPLDVEKKERCYQRIATTAEADLDLYRQDIRPHYLYKDTLKDEKRPREKALAGKTRLFSGGPFILLVNFRRYFGAFMSMYMEANIHVGSAIGINPYSAQWDSMSRNLLKFSDNHKDPTIGAGDYAGYDTCLMPAILNQVFEIIARWYGDSDPEANKIRRYLWMEITNSRHIYAGKVYYWFGGMPSGNPMTALINTIANNLIFRVAYQFAELPIDTFNEKVYMVALGDDNVFATDKSIRESFNELKMPALMLKCGMKYTTELKGTAIVPARPITEVGFLKRSFRFDKQLSRWVAPVEMESITEMLNWTKKGREGDQIAVDNVLNALRELSLHGRETFDKWKDHLLSIMQECYPGIRAHGTLPTTFETAYAKVLTLDHYY